MTQFYLSLSLLFQQLNVLLCYWIENVSLRENPGLSMSQLNREDKITETNFKADFYQSFLCCIKLDYYEQTPVTINILLLTFGC